MSSGFTVDIFVEDRAHEAFLLPMLRRVARDEGVEVVARVRSGRGGHGRALDELKLYQLVAVKGLGQRPVPDLLVVGIDGNCSTFVQKRLEIRRAVDEPFAGGLVVACPDPHVERWYVADPESFHAVVGQSPRLGKRKCARDYYKEVLATALRQGGHAVRLGGIEFAEMLVAAMDLYRASKNDPSLGAFVDDLRASLRSLRQRSSGRAG